MIENSSYFGNVFREDHCTIKYRFFSSFEATTVTQKNKDHVNQSALHQRIPGNTCFFAVLDPYYLTHDTIPLDLGGHINETQISWLRSQLAQTKAVHKFLFIHTPYYYVFNEPGEPSTSDTSYTRLWALLDSNKFDFWACGHSHLFSRRTIDPGVAPDPQTIPQTPAWKNNVVQLLNGTCGAGPDPGVIDPSIKTSRNVYNDSLTYYFSVIDVAGNTITVNSYRGYTGAYSLFDTFVVTR